MIACALCLSGCRSKDTYSPFSKALKEGETFTAPCECYCIDKLSAQKIAMEILMKKAEGEVE